MRQRTAAGWRQVRGRRRLWPVRVSWSNLTVVSDCNRDACTADPAAVAAEMVAAVAADVPGHIEEVAAAAVAAPESVVEARKAADSCQQHPGRLAA